MAQKGSLQFARLKVNLQIDDIDYDGQITECEKRIDRLLSKKEAQRSINFRTFQEAQLLLETAVSELTHSEYAIDDFSALDNYLSSSIVLD